MGIYMDYNSPIYREKYLKYKKKYMELKATEDQTAAGFFDKNPAKAITKEIDAKLSTGYVAGMGAGPVYKAINANKDASKTADELLKGIYSEHLKFDSIQAYVDDEVTKKLADVHKTALE